MIRILTLSTLFPDASRPVFGPFVERQTLCLADHPDVQLRVVAPIGMPPWPLSHLQHYRASRDVVRFEQWRGLDIYRPRFSHIPGAAGRFDGASMARALMPLLTKIRRDFPFDIIDAEFFFPDGPAAIRLGRAFEVPVSIKARGSDIHFWGSNPATRQQVLYAGQVADGMLAVSAALKRDMISLGMPEDRIAVHYTGVDLDRFKPGDRNKAKQQLGISGPLISCIGGLIERKGQSLILGALARLPGATLVLIGDGPDRAILQAEADVLGIADRVLFAGAIDQTEIISWLQASDVMALASASEGLANAWVEALACGTPIVIGDVGGAKELLSDPVAGRIVPRTSGAIADAIASLLNAPPDPENVRRLAEPFTWARNTSALYQHFSSLVRK